MIAQIRDIAAQLQAVYPADEAESLAWWIAEETTGLSRTQLLCGCKGTTNFPKLQNFCDKNDLCIHKNQFIAQKDCSSQDNANVEIIDRLLHFEPIQYIFGHTLWCGLDLKVTPATLIPRPETAELVETIINHKFEISNCRVIDIGTGSGCIAIALKKRHPEWQVTGIDISPEAIEVARENARRNNVDVEFYVADIFDSIEENHQYDIVVSNPPYICESEKSSMRLNVLDYEPSAALFVPDSDPLRFYRRIASLFTLPLGRAGVGFLFFEINEAYPAELVSMLEGMGYTDIHITNDIYGKPRIIDSRMVK